MVLLLSSRTGAGNTNAFLILGIFSFYIFVFVMLGLIGESQYQASNGYTKPSDPSAGGFLSDIAFFFSGIGFTITNIPVWANSLIFLPLGITVFYIILSFFRGSS